MNYATGKLIKKVESSILTDNRTAILRLSAAPRYMVLSTFIDQVRFQCYANGQPAKHGQTVWTRGDEIVPCNTSNRVFACVNIIVITHVSAQDAGKYKCLSKDNHLNSYTVSILVPAKIDGVSNKIVTVSPGENKQLHCSVSSAAYPQPVSIFWTLHGSYISAGEILQLRNIGSNLTGEYKCTAYNGFGVPATKTFNVTFSGRTESTTTPLALFNDVKSQTVLSTSATLNSAHTNKRVDYLSLGIHLFACISLFDVLSTFT